MTLLDAYNLGVLRARYEYQCDPFAASRLIAIAVLMSERRHRRISAAEYARAQREVLAW